MVKYLNKERFDINKPLQPYPTGYIDKTVLKYNKFEIPKEFDLFDTLRSTRIELGDRKIVFGVKAQEEVIENYDFIWSFDGGSALIVHNRVLEKLNELCPKDFQALPVIIKNLDPNSQEKFANNSFWLINILQKRRIFDKSCIYYSPNGTPQMNRQIVMDNSMGDALLAREEVFSSSVFFRPSLAKHFIKSKGVKFLTDEEASFGRTEVGITEAQKERYKSWSLLPD